MVEKLLGVIGGSGLYSMNELNVIEKVSVDTPFGPPSEDVSYRRTKWDANGVPATPWCRALHSTIRD